MSNLNLSNEAYGKVSQSFFFIPVNYVIQFYIENYLNIRMEVKYPNTKYQCEVCEYMSINFQLKTSHQISTWKSRYQNKFSSVGNYQVRNIFM